MFCWELCVKLKKRSENLREVGTGTGLISLMLSSAEMQGTEITTLDLNEDAVNWLKENFKILCFRKVASFHIKILKFLHRKRRI